MSGIKARTMNRSVIRSLCLSFHLKFYCIPDWLTLYFLVSDWLSVTSKDQITGGRHHPEDQDWSCSPHLPASHHQSLSQLPLTRVVATLLVVHSIKNGNYSLVHTSIFEKNIF